MLGQYEKWTVCHLHPLSKPNQISINNYCRANTFLFTVYLYTHILHGYSIFIKVTVSPKKKKILKQNWSGWYSKMRPASLISFSHCQEAWQAVQSSGRQHGTPSVPALQMTCRGHCPCTALQRRPKRTITLLWQDSLQRNRTQDTTDCSQ